MFDIGFWELGLIGLISLLVIGPERLPKVARVVGFWMGRSRRMIHSMKQEISEELHAEEMRQILHQQTPVEEMEKLIDEGRQTIHAFAASEQQENEAGGTDQPPKPSLSKSSSDEQ